MTDENLIAKAVEAIDALGWHGHDGGDDPSSDDIARVAFAVFEKAHVTTAYHDEIVGQAQRRIHELEAPTVAEDTTDERTQAGLDSERLRQIAEWLGMELGHEETAKRVSLIADRHDRLAVGFRRAPKPEVEWEYECRIVSTEPGWDWRTCTEDGSLCPSGSERRRRRKAGPWEPVPEGNEGEK